MNRKYKEKQQQQLEKCNELLLKAGLISNDFLTKGHSEVADSLKNKKISDKKVEDKEEAKEEEEKKNNYKEKLIYIADLLDFEVKFQSLTKVCLLF